MNDATFFFLELYYQHKRIEYKDFRNKHLIDGFVAKDEVKHPISFYGNKLRAAYLIQYVINEQGKPIGDICEITEAGEREYIKEKQKRDFEAEKLRLEYDLSKITFQTNQSVIQTNQSVRYVNKLFWAILFLTFVSAVGTVGTFILELRKEQQKSLPPAKQPQTDTAKKVQHQQGNVSHP